MNDNFKIGFEKTAYRKDVAAIAVINKDKKILLGMRRDNKKWTNPGGHLEKGENPVEGAKREMLEETGVDIPASKFKSLGKSKKVGDLTIYPFKVGFEGSVSNSKDPDEEVSRWRWCDTTNMPEEVMKNLHVPPKDNILINRLGIGMKKNASSRLSKYVAKKFFKSSPKGMGGVHNHKAIHPKVDFPISPKKRIPEAEYSKKVLETKKPFKQKKFQESSFDTTFGDIPIFKRQKLKQRLKGKFGKK